MTRRWRPPCPARGQPCPARGQPRKSASENGEKLGLVYEGEKLELVMKQADGWTRVKYNGQTAFVKSDYVE